LLCERIAVLERECSERQQTLLALRRLQHGVVSSSALDLDELVETIAMTTQLNVEWTAQQRADFARRAEQLGAAGMAEAQQLWPELIAQVRAALDAGIPAQAPAAQELARRWYALVQAFTGGDAQVTRTLGEAYHAQPQVMAAQGLDPALFAYVGERRLALKRISTRDSARLPRFHRLAPRRCNGAILAGRIAAANSCGVDSGKNPQKRSRQSPAPSVLRRRLQRACLLIAIEQHHRRCAALRQ
jgi:hypothetical protein